MHSASDPVMAELLLWATGLVVLSAGKRQIPRVLPSSQFHVVSKVGYLGFSRWGGESHFFCALMGTGIFLTCVCNSQCRDLPLLSSARIWVVVGLRPRLERGLIHRWGPQSFFVISLGRSLSSFALKSMQLRSFQNDN